MFSPRGLWVIREPFSQMSIFWGRWGTAYLSGRGLAASPNPFFVRASRPQKFLRFSFYEPGSWGGGGGHGSRAGAGVHPSGRIRDRRIRITDPTLGFALIGGSGKLTDTSPSIPSPHLLRKLHSTYPSPILAWRNFIIPEQ